MTEPRSFWQLGYDAGLADTDDGYPEDPRSWNRGATSNAARDWRRGWDAGEADRLKAASTASS